MKKFLRLDFILFAIITLLLWIFANYIIVPKANKYHSVFGHNDIHQHTLQALAWQRGHLGLDAAPKNLELVFYEGKVYNSFPATPTLVEFPFTLFYGLQTPNNAVQMVCVWLAMLMSFFILERLTGNRLLSYTASFSFFWGTNILYLSFAAPVWHQGHMYGLFFAVLAFYILFFSNHAWQLALGALSLGLCVGCRPFYFLYIPFYVYLAARQYPLKQAVFWIFIGLIPPGLFTGLLNLVRFGSPTVFGHDYLEYSRLVNYDVFGFKYFPRNFYYTFLNLPTWVDQHHFINFHGRGTSILLISPFMFMGFAVFFKKDVPVYDKIMGGMTVFAIWFMLLLHCGNGWYQFGYRYAVDIIPVFIILFAWSYKKLHKWLIPVCVYSVIANVYGTVWFYALQHLIP